MTDKTLAYVTAVVAKRQRILEEGYQVLAQHLRAFADEIESPSAALEALRLAFPWCPENVARQRQMPTPDWALGDPSVPDAADQLRFKWIDQQAGFTHLSKLYGAIRGGAGEETLYPAE